MDITLPASFRFAINESRKSEMHDKVGACLVVGKSSYSDHNSEKTHTVFANPKVHLRLSLHAEMACLLKAGLYAEGGVIYVYREVKNLPALARPCEQCIPVLKEHGVKKMIYSTNHYPFWKEEWL